MKSKRTIFLIIATLFALVLAGVAVVTSLKLKQLATVPVAPNVPTSKPMAAEASPEAVLEVEALGAADMVCQLEFKVTAISCYNGPCTADNQCAAGLVCVTPPGNTIVQGKVCLNATCPEDSDCVCGANPTPAPKCDDSCSSNNDCPSDLKCIDKKCRNEKCPGESDCGCPLVCNDYCANDGDCPDGLKCSWNKCRNKECPDDNDCSCAKPPGCNETCNPDNAENECVGGYVCDKTTKTCRNSTCLGEADCTCEVAGKVKPPQEEMPEAGNPIPGFMFLAAGAMLVILGVVVVGL